MTVRRSRLHRHLLSIAAILCTVAVLFTVLSWWMLNAEITTGENGMVFIPRNTAVVAAIDSINAKCPLPWPWLVKASARIAMRLRPLHIQSGWYMFTKGDTQLDVLKALFTGSRRPTVLVTIPEGLTKWEVASRLSRSLDVDSALILLHADTLEGRLFPNTYEFFWREDPLVVVNRMTSEFVKQTNGEHVTDSILILASIVQAEAASESEMPKIAGVYVNRLAREIHLEADPTVQYGLRSKQRVTYGHLNNGHDWNTYIHSGLPPTPICSPGLAAIHAALHPDTHGYLFFVARGDGSGLHRFANTFNEHKQNVQKYRQARSKQSKR